MDYITIREAAEKWGISLRLTQRLCTQGRVPGARKFGGAWAIPADAVKPGRLNQQKPRPKTAPPLQSEPDPLLSIMPLMNTAFVPGQCRRAVSSMPEGPRKNIARAEYYYFSGQAEKAVKAVEPYLSSPDVGQRISACWIYGYASLAIGQIQQARRALETVRDVLSQRDVLPSRLAAAVSFVAAGAAVLLHLPVPEESSHAEEVLPLLPLGLRAFALYIRAHALYLQKDYSKSLGIAETALAMGADQYPIPAIYLHLVTVMDYMRLRQVNRAHAHLLAAWQLARPDDLIEAFGEHHGLLGGTLEAVLKQDWPDDLWRILDVTCRFSWGWRRIHNPDTGHEVADNLTTTEFAVAMLTAQSWTCREIAAHMGISCYMVKRHQSAVKKKLGISRRKELKQYMLQ